MDRRLNILQLKSRVNSLPWGYVDFVLSRGKIEGDEVLLDDAALNQVREKYARLGAPGLFSLRMLTASKAHQPPGYVDYILQHSKVKADLVIMDMAKLREFQRKFPRQKRAFLLERKLFDHDKVALGSGRQEFLTARAKTTDEFYVLDSLTLREFRQKFFNPRERKQHLTLLKEDAKTRPKGFMEYALARGRMEGENVVWDIDVLKEIRQKFPQTLPFKIKELKESTPRRPKGFVEFVLAHGKIEGDVVKLEPIELKLLNERFPAHFLPSPPDPTPTQMAANFAGAMKDWAKAGFKTVPRKVYDERVATCDACPHWDAEARGGMGKCAVCGCTKLKFWLASSICPDKPPRW